LSGAIWSEDSKIKILAWQILNKLSSEGWAQNLLDQIYLDDAELALAQAESSTESAKTVRDSNGVVLADGDSVTLIKDLDVKGANFVAKRGLLVKKISLTDDPERIECRVNGTAIFLKTCFLKKA
jgi:protein PhnA